MNMALAVTRSWLQMIDMSTLKLRRTPNHFMSMQASRCEISTRLLSTEINRESLRRQAVWFQKQETNK